jgi:ATP-grasp ribosomal peptide maturase
VTAAATVLVVAGDDDPTADAVVFELRHRPVRTVRLDLAEFPTSLRIAAVTGSQPWDCRLWTETDSVEFSQIRSIFYHRPNGFVLPDSMSAGDAAFARAEARKAVGGILACVDALWVNDPAKVAVAEYKALQQKVAVDAGLAIPRTLVTNDHSALTEFAAETGGPLVCKTLSSFALGVAGRPRITYTTPIDPVDVDPAELNATAHLIQEWVPKAYEARITMVGHRPYGVAIHAASDAAYVDWRADYASLAYKPIEPPAEQVAGMSTYLDRFGLNFGAFDFAITPDDRWIMFECNPDGMWYWLNDHTATPIVEGMADLLVEGAPE